MLPEGFRWAKRWEYASGENAICLGSTQVAFVDLMADGVRWWARLECHKGLDYPLVSRQCTSYEAGRRGCELWVCRHEERLRREVAEILARRRR